MFDFDDALPFAAAEAVKAAAARIWETLAFRLDSLGTSGTLEELEDVVCGYRSDGSDTCGLDLDEQVSLCEHLAEDCDVSVPGVKDWSDLRRTIAEAADHCVMSAAQAECRAALSELCALIERLGLDFSHVERTNGLGWLPHRSERSEESARAQVYEYRRADGGEVDVDVWEVQVFPGSRIYLSVPV